MTDAPLCATVFFGLRYTNLSRNEMSVLPLMSAEPVWGWDSRSCDERSEMEG